MQKLKSNYLMPSYDIHLTLSKLFLEPNKYFGTMFLQRATECIWDCWQF